MAKAPTSTRAAVTERGAALLALIAASTDPSAGVLMLTQDEGAEAVNAGHAIVDTTNVSGNLAAVSLTDAGKAALATVNGEGTEAVEDGEATGKRFDIDDGVPMPTDTARRGRSGGYPFDKLNVGQSFHVAKTADNTDPATRLASSVSGARAAFAEPDGDKTKVVNVKTYKRGDDGEFVKVDGKRVIETETEETRPVMKLTRDFIVKTVGKDDPKGEGARVWRTA